MISLLAYEILKGSFKDYVTDPKAIQVALSLQKQRLVSCFSSQKGYQIQLNKDEIDLWMQKRLNQESVFWIKKDSCVYGLYNPHKEPDICLIQSKTVLKPFFETLWIQIDLEMPFHAPLDLMVPFADVFCKKISLSAIINTLQRHPYCLILTHSAQAIYLQDICLATSKSILKKSILKILIQHHQENASKIQYDFLSLDTIAQKLHESEGIFIDDCDNKIRRPLGHIVQQVSEHLSLSEKAFIENQKGAYRLAPFVLVKNL